MFLNLIIFALSLALVIFILYQNFKKKKRLAGGDISPGVAHSLLLKHVQFYEKLTPAEQEEFVVRAKVFLSKVTIRPVENLKITTLDRLYVAASAVIPIFGRKGWGYNNLDQVLIYPGNFNKEFELEGEGTDVMGMVGNGVMNRTMIISIGALRAGFEQAGRGNTGIHEFVHLLDKADGATDGVPEYLLPKELIQPWLDYVHRAIMDIHKGQSDINPYGATNNAEFLAVISEYFFQKPDKLKDEHPELWKMLEKMYMPDEVGDLKEKPPQSLSEKFNLGLK